MPLSAGIGHGLLLKPTGIHSYVSQGLEDICNFLSVGRAGSLITRWTAIFVEPPRPLVLVKMTRKKLSKTSPIALIISTVLIGISIYSLVVLVFVSITVRSWQTLHQH